MRKLSQISGIPGGKELIDWFGGVPSFHDSEILSLQLDRSGNSHLVIHAFRMTDQTDERGFYTLDREFVATFEFSQILELKLEGFSEQNVVGELMVTTEDATTYIVEIDAIYGLGGRIGCKTLSLTFVSVSDPG